MPIIVKKIVLTANTYLYENVISAKTIIGFDPTFREVFQNDEAYQKRRQH